VAKERPHPSNTGPLAGAFKRSLQLPLAHQAQHPRLRNGSLEFLLLDVGGEIDQRPGRSSQHQLALAPNVAPIDLRNAMDPDPCFGRHRRPTSVTSTSRGCFSTMDHRYAAERWLINAPSPHASSAADSIAIEGSARWPTMYTPR
jgi:hypothetical protein